MFLEFTVFSLLISGTPSSFFFAERKVALNFFAWSGELFRDPDRNKDTTLLDPSLTVRVPQTRLGAESQTRKYS
jgi:hypothetical protein